MKARVNLEWAVVLALATFAFVNALCWARVIPLGDAPDEPGHFEVVAFEFVFRDIPEFGVDDYGTMVRIARDGYRSPLNTYSAQPGLSYLFSVAAIDLLPGAADEPARSARYPGALWAALMTIVVFVGAEAMFPRERGVAVLAATIVTCWPQLAFVFSYINNDGLTALVSAALITSWFVGRNNEWRDKDAAWLGLAAGLVLLNKPNGFPLVGVAGMVFLATLGGPWRQRLRRALVAMTAAVASCGWWYVIAFRRYGWDLLAAERADRLRQQLGVEWASGRFYGKTLLETALDPFPRFGQTWIVGTLRSAVGVFGELTVPLPELAYVLVCLLTLASVVGCVAFMVKSKRSQINCWLQGATFLLVPGFLVLALYRSWAHDFQAQGRYLFPAILPFVVFLSVGLIGPLRGRWRGVVGFLVTVTFFSILVDGFVVRLLGAYRLSFGGLLETTLVPAALWAVSLVAALGSGILYWLRVAITADRPTNGE